MNGPLPTGEDLRGKRVLVMGLGRFGGGLTVARYLAKHGAEVCVTDLNTAEELLESVNALGEWPIRFVLGKHDEEDFRNAELVVANPAVPPRNRFLQIARDHGIPITSEMELFLHSTQAQVLLVSGTHGKSSTVTFLEQLLRDRNRPVFLGGNIGRSLLDEPGAMREEAQCVVEISSYQLESLGPALPQVHAAGLTALAPDHLERHGDLAEYLRCKSLIFDCLQPGAQAYLPQDWWARAPFDQLRAERTDLHWLAYGNDQDLGLREGRLHRGAEDLGDLSEFQVHGEFQRQNLLLAMGLALSTGLTSQELAGRLASLQGPPHRLRKLPPGPGHSVFDNGVSTTPETTLAAVESLPAPLVLLVGGQPKAGLAYDELALACARRGDRVYLFGAAAQDLKQVFAEAGGPFEAHSTLLQAMQAAWQHCQPGQTLLFSPACASFDAFPNFQARAQLFLDQVRSLRETQGPIG